MADKNSYNSQFYADLASAAEKKAGLPAGLLTAIVTKGERSNADQVSEAGAKTVFQIIPSTRDAVLKKYGVDAYLSPENAAEASAYLLKESLDRNNGNVAAAVGEYHGGTDRSNWGPKTRAYIARVVNSGLVGQQQSQKPQQLQNTQLSTGSTFDRVMQQMQASQPDANSIANVFNAYQSGQMTTEEAAAFESDVKSGSIMLPRGAQLKQDAAKHTGGAIMLPQSVSEAYVSGQMTPEERAALEEDIRAGIVQLPASIGSLIPGESPDWQRPTVQNIVQQAPEETIGQKLYGALEAGTAAVTGTILGGTGQVAGTVEGVAKSIMDGTYGTQQGVQNAADLAARRAQQAQQYGVIPRTESGKEYLENLGDVMNSAMAGMPLTAELGAIARSAAQARPYVQSATGLATQAAKDAVIPPVVRAVEAVKSAPQAVAETIGIGKPRAEVSPVATPEMLAAQAVREQKAAGLDVPIALTKGELTRDAAQLGFEDRAMKTPEVGAPLRQRAEESNINVLENFDRYVEQTGAKTESQLHTGQSTLKGLTSGYDVAMARTRSAFKIARQSDEAKAIVDTSKPVTVISMGDEIDGTVADYLNGKVRGVPSSAVTDAARQIAVKTGIVDEMPDGSLANKPATVGQLEDFRREMSGIAKWDDKSGRRDELLLKKIVDKQTEPVAGPLFKEARRLRTIQARKFENRGIVARMLTNKNGTDDPKMLASEFFNKAIINGSPEEITFLKRVLHTSGEDGRQAWQDIRGEMARYIKEESTKGNALDSQNNPIVSASKLHNAVRKLDADKRLDIVLGKEIAQKVRNLNDVVGYINTVPAGTLINNSGTALTVGAIISDMMLSGAAGITLPLATSLKFIKGQIQSKQMKAKIQDALNTKSGKF